MGELKNLRVFLMMFWEYHKNNKSLEKFFRLRKFQMPEWGKGLFAKWVCENGLLWYVISKIEAIIEKQIMIIAFERRMREQAIEELKQKIAELEKQISRGVKLPRKITYRSPALCEMENKICS